jgi:hypothetical protein
MALTQLSDIIDVTVYQDIPAVDSPELTAFYQSGIITRSPFFDELASAPGKIAELPFWKDIDATDAPNISTDNPATIGVPGKIVQGEQISRKLQLNNGWSEADLAAERAMGGDALTRVRARADTYWRRQWQRYLIAATNGVLADNVANDSGDMVHDVASESIAGQSAATRFNRAAFNAAAFTLGDAFQDTGVFAVHSHVMQQMSDNDDIDFIPDSKGEKTIPTFMGRRVVVDDSMTVVAGSTDGFKYTSVLYGSQAIAWGEGNPKVPVEVEREATQGNGGGVETLWTRKTHIIHPLGYQFTSSSVASESATLAEMALAANWDRVIERKNVPLAYLITN